MLDQSIMGAGLRRGMRAACATWIRPPRVSSAAVFGRVERPRAVISTSSQAPLELGLSGA